MLVFADMSIGSVIMNDNTANTFTNGIYISHSEVNITYSFFSNEYPPNGAVDFEQAAAQSELYGGFIYVSGSENSIYISESTFTNGYAAYGGSIYNDRSSFIQITD